MERRRYRRRGLLTKGDWIRIIAALVVSVCWFIAVLRVEDTSTFVAIILTAVMCNQTMTSHENSHH